MRILFRFVLQSIPKAWPSRLSHGENGYAMSNGLFSLDVNLIYTAPQSFSIVNAILQFPE